MIDEKKLIEEIVNTPSECLDSYSVSSVQQGIQYGCATRQNEIIDIINRQPQADKWIPCEVEMPKEHESMFAKFKGTDKWAGGMFEKISDEVNVTVELEDGSRITKTTHTIDGKWSVETNSFIKQKIIAWQPLPHPYKKEGAE